MAARTLTSTELAEELGTNPRKVRRFMREQGQGVGRGQRYHVPASRTAMNALQKKYSAWGGTS